MRLQAYCARARVSVACVGQRILVPRGHFSFPTDDSARRLSMSNKLKSSSGKRVRISINAARLQILFANSTVNRLIVAQERSRCRQSTEIIPLFPIEAPPSSSPVSSLQPSFNRRRAFFASRTIVSTGFVRLTRNQNDSRTRLSKVERLLRRRDETRQNEAHASMSGAI